MAVADLIADIRSLVMEVNTKLGDLGDAVGAALKEKADTAVVDANSAIQKWDAGGLVNDAEAAGDLTEALGELTEVLADLAAIGA